MKLLDTPLIGPEAVAAFLKTLKPKNGSREIWLKLGHDRIFRADWTDVGTFENAYSTKCEEEGNPLSRVKTYDIPDLLNNLLSESLVKDGGLFYIPTQPQGLPTADSVITSDDIGIEHDEGTTEEQLAIFQNFHEITGLDFSSIISSGGKSTHAHLKLVDHTEWDKVEYLLRLAIVAFKSDFVTSRAHQPMRFPGGYRKEKEAYQSLLYVSDHRYTYDEMLDGLRAYYHHWGVEMPETIPDDWWDVMTTILKDKSKDPDFRLRKLLNLGYEGWQLYQESQRIIKMQKKAEYDSRRTAVSTFQGESIVDLVRKQCENLDSDPFELMTVDGEDHNWSPPLDATTTHARGACLWHDSTSGNSAWIDGRDGWTYHCSHCTNDKPLDAFDYWRLSVETKELNVDGKVWYTQHRNISGYEWVRKAKQWLSLYDVEVPQLTPDVQAIKDAIAEIKTVPGPPVLDLEKLSSGDLPWNEQVEEACRILMKQDSASMRVQYTNEIRQHFAPITEAQIREICNDVNTFHREIPTHVGEIIFDEVQKLEYKKANPGISGYRTGLGAIDTITNGFSNNNLVVVAGPSSTGKTLLAKQMALSIASNYKSNDNFEFIPHVFNSAESSTSELIIRLLCQEAYIPITKLMNGEYDDVEWMRVLTSAQRIAESNLFIDGTPEISTSQMRQKLLRLKDEYGCIGSIWVDHFNKLAKPYPNDDRASYSQIADELKSIQTEFNCPMILLSQLTSAHEGRADHRPNEYDLLFGKTLKNNLDKLLMLYNPEKWEKNPEDAGLMHVYVPKNRDGQTGMVKLEHDFAHMIFKDLPGTQSIKPIVVMAEPKEEELVEVDEYGVEVF